MAKRWIVLLEDGDKITLPGNEAPSEMLVEGVAKRLAGLGKSGYLVSVEGADTADLPAVATEEKAFGTPTVGFEEVRTRFDRRMGRGRQRGQAGWRY